MNKYAPSAINAVHLVHTTEALPPEAWELATSALFGQGTAGQVKGCPRNAFLGLCEEGLIRGIKPGSYNNKPNSANKSYAIRAVELLKSEPGLTKDKMKLWAAVVNGAKKHNSQMDIVIALWDSKLIVN
jgi:hypothetical protein